MLLLLFIRYCQIFFVDPYTDEHNLYFANFFLDSCTNSKAAYYIVIVNTIAYTDEHMHINCHMKTFHQYMLVALRI
jgi:hypothetical protein